LEFLSTALQNLRIKKGYREFHLNDIYTWSTDNFHLLRTSIASTADSWKSNFRWVLSHNPDKFQSTQRGCWGLKVDPGFLCSKNTASIAEVESFVNEDEHPKELISTILESKHTTQPKINPKLTQSKLHDLPKSASPNIQNYGNGTTHKTQNIKPSEYFMPSHYPDWISSSMMSATNQTKKRQHTDIPPTAEKQTYPKKRAGKENIW